MQPPPCSRTWSRRGFFWTETASFKTTHRHPSARHRLPTQATALVCSFGRTDVVAVTASSLTGHTTPPRTNSYDTDSQRRTRRALLTNGVLAAVLRRQQPPETISLHARDTKRGCEGQCLRPRRRQAGTRRDNTPGWCVVRDEGATGTHAPAGASRTDTHGRCTTHGRRPVQVSGATPTAGAVACSNANDEPHINQREAMLLGDGVPRRDAGEA